MPGVTVKSRLDENLDGIFLYQILTIQQVWVIESVTIGADIDRIVPRSFME